MPKNNYTNRSFLNGKKIGLTPYVTYDTHKKRTSVSVKCSIIGPPCQADPSQILLQLNAYRFD